MPTIEAIDEALHHASLVPIDERGKPWHAFVDSLLAQRNRITAPVDARATRVLAVAETR